MAPLMIGIDPGVRTGLAIWHREKQQLVDVQTTSILGAMNLVKTTQNLGTLHSVRFEDARLRTWFGAKGKEALQGAGSIKRDCSIWEEFLDGLVGVPFTPVSPQGKGVKVSAAQFQRLTGWAGRTSEHSRDAAMLVWKA